MAKIKKKKAKKREASDFQCQVKGCPRRAQMGWGSRGIYKRVCLYCHSRHTSKTDKFDFRVEFDIPFLTMELGRFGHPLPRDAAEFAAETARMKEEKGAASIDRLKRWKATQKGRKREKKRKPPPRPEVIEREETAFDDIVGDILGNEG